MMVDGHALSATRAKIATGPVKLEKHVLLVGWFSTVGDIEVLEFAKEALSRMRVRYSVSSVIDPISMALNVPLLAEIDATSYSHVLWVCGPVWAGMPQWHDLRRFSHCVFGGINLTLIGFSSLEDTPFDYVHARDWGGAGKHIDLSFYTPLRKVPVIGVVLAPDQNEYGQRQRHAKIGLAIDALKKRVDWAFIHLDTRWPARDIKDLSLRSPEEFEAVLSRLDFVITSRLHGLVLSRKNGVPVVAVDPVSGGDKVSAQARLLGAECLSADEADLALRIQRIIEDKLACRRDDPRQQEIDEGAFARLKSDLVPFFEQRGGRSGTFFRDLRTGIRARLGSWLSARKSQFRYRGSRCRRGVFGFARRLVRP